MQNVVAVGQKKERVELLARRVLRDFAKQRKRGRVSLSDDASAIQPSRSTSRRVSKAREPLLEWLL